MKYTFSSNSSIPSLSHALNVVGVESYFKELTQNASMKSTYESGGNIVIL